ncbi:MAG: bacterial Ig-like domain-containing protein, partial [Bacteroidales bacterium]|nr:bacterial Ig-like domain-containing protein [Bacteroidales bacterium]
DASTYLQRIPLPDAVGYDDIAINSTCMVARMATDEASLFALIPQTVFIWRGSAFVWMDANWSGGIITLTLQRVSQPAVVVTPQPPVTLVSINAQFNQGGTIYDTDDLSTLKQYLTVTAEYSDGTTRELTKDEYTLSGMLTAPSSTITVSYDGFTDTFTVQVTHQQVLPYDAQVEYLQGDGDAYIDTGIAGGNDTLSIEIKAYWSGFVNYAAFFGNWSGSDDYNSTRIIQSNEGIRLYGGINQRGIVLTINATLNAWHIILLEKNYFTLDGVRVSISNISKSTNNSNIALFNRSVVNPYTVKRDIGLKYEYVKFMDNGVLVRDYIPVRVGTTGYLYDKVSGTLFGNIGTGNFILGNDV